MDDCGQEVVCNDPEETKTAVIGEQGQLSKNSFGC
jgi:hypothetical protein